MKREEEKDGEDEMKLGRESNKREQEQKKNEGRE